MSKMKILKNYEVAWNR